MAEWFFYPYNTEYPKNQVPYAKLTFVLPLTSAEIISATDRTTFLFKRRTTSVYIASMPQSPAFAQVLPRSRALAAPGNTANSTC